MDKITNREVASIFATVADMLEIKGESIHRILAYRRAAETISSLPRDLYAIYEEDGLTDLPGIGATLAEKISEMLTTGKLAFYEQLAEEIPPGVVDMLQVTGIGPKKAARFWNELGIIDLDQLKKAAQDGRLRDLPGMGTKSEAAVLEGIEAHARRTARWSIGDAYPVARLLLDHLLSIDGVVRGDIAGSLRRYRATIGDIDILIAGHNPEPIMQTLVQAPEVSRVLAHGTTKSSVEFHSGLQIDLRVLPPERYGTLLAYFTGSKEHNVKLRELALKKGLSLNEHGFTPVAGGNEILCATEEEVYAVLGLPWIPPELRENRGELETAQDGKLPELIELKDIKGDLQLHTTWSDGKSSILEMAKAALERGYQYMLVTDHTYGLGVVQGMSPQDVAAQREEVDAANAELAGEFTVLQGAEVEIRADGKLDYDDETLARLDLVQASLHTSLRQPREQITARLINAIRNPYITIIGHPRSKLYPNREGADLDMDAVFAAAAEHDVALEINANPSRLDLDDVHARRAAEFGVKLTISTDAHHPQSFDLMHYGVGTARRGWISANQVVNTWPLEKVRQWIKERRR